MMFWIGIVTVVLGVLIGALGWVLNTQTPIQQPLPVVGIVMILIGASLIMLFH